jgi:hypothetical protein
MKNRWLAYWGCVLLLGLSAVWLVDRANVLAAHPPAGCTCGCGGTPRPFCAHRCSGNPCTGTSAKQESSPAADAAKGCACGCGGTPRPACAHSCGGNPCTGGALNTSRIIIGEVVENQPSSFSVVGQNGNSLTGFVVEFDDGQQVKTDDRGEATFTPKSHKALKANIPGVAATSVHVLTAEQASKSPSRVPRFTTAGTQMSVTRAGMFDGNAGNTHAKIGSMPCAVMFESPHQAILFVPAETPLGTSSLHIEDQGKTIEQPISVVQFSLQADKLKLARGESTQGKAVVQGADANLIGGVIRIKNLSPQTVALQAAGGGTDTIEKRIEPGMIHNGQIEIPLTISARRGGGFQVVGGVFDPKALSAATCSCGCGGTARPACAYSCGGNPCTGASVHQ